MANQPRSPRLPDKIIRELKGTDWRLELGSKHWKLLINNQFVGVFPKGKFVDRNISAMNNTIAKIRRAKGLTEVTQ